MKSREFSSAWQQTHTQAEALAPIADFLASPIVSRTNNLSSEVDRKPALMRDLNRGGGAVQSEMDHVFPPYPPASYEATQEIEQNQVYGESYDIRESDTSLFGACDVSVNSVHDTSTRCPHAAMQNMSLVGKSFQISPSGTLTYHKGGQTDSSRVDLLVVERETAVANLSGKDQGIISICSIISFKSCIICSLYSRLHRFN